MIIREMFNKDINRDVRGVIVVGEEKQAYVKQELEEYVVTKELQRYFADFFSAYKKGIVDNTPDMGVWISGFFGSGKSHFLKILSYILQNKVVDGKKAIDYFIEDNKISDQMVLADMKLASETPTDAVLFNIDSKSSATGKENKDAIVKVFLKVFNEMQGFCGSMPHLADLEKRLTDLGKYDEFKAAVKDECGQDWEEVRSDFDFIQDTVVEVLDKLDVMSEAAARNWCEKAIEAYEVSPEEFAERVNKYIESRGKNHHVVFLVDEVGQYIGDNSQLMLNLQTIVEELGVKCKGKAWVAVTSQQDIDSVTKVIGQDFSKIQGRFKTRISMSSANVDEVIKKRILEKTDTAAQSLRVLYQNKATVIKNLIIFNDGVEKKLYANENDFAEVYPFIPYQFNVLASVLTSIRTHGASGKHLSEGERSMLALFKESAMKSGDREMGAIIPFYKFYDALEKFLDHSHRGVILRAYENSHINPEKKDSDVFEINVLKTLFMIKYIAEVDPNLENITSLMISNIDEDRIQLKNKVDAALRVLDGQKVIQKNGDSYMFLTDEEQEIRRDIDSQNVDQAEILNKVAEILFEDILPEKKYKYSKFGGRYTFQFNQFVDDRPYKSGQSNDIGLRILTPWYTRSTHDSTLRMVSGESKEVIVLLPTNDAAFLSEISTYLKIEKFLRLNTSDKLVKYEAIRSSVSVERRERGENAKTFLKDNLAEATIYVNGDVVPLNSKDYQNRINEALGKLVATVYNKLYYIEYAFDAAAVRKLFDDSSYVSLKNGDTETSVNKHALDDVLSFISLNTKAHMKVSMKAVKEQFMKAPYGFVEDDICWLVAKLFLAGNLSFTVNGESATLQNKTHSELIDYITKKQYVEKLLIEERTGVDPKHKKAAKDVIKELFNTSVVNDDEDAIMKDFQTYASSKINSLQLLEAKYDRNHPYPGKEIVLQGKDLLRTVLQQSKPVDFFKTVFISQNDLFKFAEDLEPVETFFSGEQREIFDRAVDLMAIFNESKAYIADNDVESLAESIQDIIDEDEPYKDIPKLPELRENFIKAYSKILKKENEPVIVLIEQDRDRVIEVLNTKNYKEEFFDRIWKYYQDLISQVKKSNNIAKIHSFESQSKASKIKFLSEMDKKDAELAKENESSDNPIPVHIKNVKHISIKTAIGTTSWSIKSREDIDKYMADLRKKIESELEGCDEIFIEF